MIKQVWLTERTEGGELVSISIESENFFIPITVREIELPMSPNPRHVVNLGLFDDHDIILLIKALTEHDRKRGALP